jgi:hypothetical protein
VIRKPVIVSLASAAIAVAAGGAIVAGFAGVAHAAGPPPWETSGSGGGPADPNEAGGLLFFNSAGQQITGGSVSSLGAFVEGTTTLHTGDTKATLFAFTPVNGQPAGSWSNDQLSGSTTYPVSSPANLASSTLPVVSNPTSNLSFTAYESEFPNNDTSTTDGYAGLYQLRLFTSSPVTTTTYDSADILISGTGSSATWTVDYPSPTPIATTTVVTSNASTLEASPTGNGTAVYTGVSINLRVTVTAADGSSPAGTVQFENGSTAIGSPVTVSGGSATLPDSTLPVGTDTINAVFTPAAAGTDSSGDTLVGYASSTNNSANSASVPIVQAPADNTSVALVPSPMSSVADTAVTLTATVSDTTDAGTTLGSGSGSVLFYDNGSTNSASITASSTLLGTVPVGSGGSAALSYGSFATGSHYIVAQFQPTNPATFNGSTSAAVLYTATAPTVTPALAPVTVTIPAGSLTITTPYTTASPFALGTASLTPSTGNFTASATFGSSADSGTGYTGVTVTNTRSGDAGWSAYVEASNFAEQGGGGVINAQNLSFTGVAAAYITGDNLSPTNPITTENDTSSSEYAPGATGTDGLAGIPHQFATKAQPDTGTVGIYGTLSLRAPSSTPAGTYSTTLTFTAS